MHIASGIRSRTAHFEQIARSRAQDSFRHVTATGVSRAENQYFWFIHFNQFSTTALGGTAGGRGVGFAQSFHVIPKDGVFSKSVLQTFQVFREQLVRLRWQAINGPIGHPLGFNQSIPAQIAQMLGHLDLRFLQDLLQMTHTQRPFPQQMQNPQPRSITEAFVNRNGVHIQSIPE